MSQNYFSWRRGLLGLLILGGMLVLSSCGGSAGKKDEPPSFKKPEVLVPETPGKETLGTSELELDVSNLDHGYFSAVSSDNGLMKSIQMIMPVSGTTYTYFLEPGETAVIPFTEGDGSYFVSCYQQVEGSQYAALCSEQLEVELSNLFYPWLYPNQYVSFTPDTEACKLAQEMLPDDASDLDALAAIYDYVTENVVYDEKKAVTVEPGYLPNVDHTLHEGTGICFDYAALMAAMLRARGIPCRLVTGYAGTVKHAWIDVYILSKGWVEQAISFDGETWTRMDPTFDASSTDDELIYSYIGDGNNYSEQYAH